MKHSDEFNQKGFVALVSAVLISAVLTVMAVSSARNGFWGRFNALNRENKNISALLAESCANIVLLGLVKGEKIFPPEIAVEDDKKCQIIDIKTVQSDVWEVRARAVWKNSYTNLLVGAKIVSGELIITEWREM